jgi:predicted Zn-dependent protease
MKRLQIPDISIHTELWIEDEVENLSWNDEEYKQLVTLLLDQTRWRDKDKDCLHLEINLSLLTGGRSSAHVLKLIFADANNSNIRDILIIRSHLTQNDANTERETVKTLNVNNTKECFANILEEEAFSLPNRYLVIYHDVAKMVARNEANELCKTIFENLDPKKPTEEIKHFALNFQELIRQATVAYGEVKKGVKKIDSEIHCQQILSQLPPDFVISHASLFESSSGDCLIESQKTSIDTTQFISVTDFLSSKFSEQQDHWLQLQEKIWLEDEILMGESKTAYLPFFIKCEPKVRIWLEIDKNKVEDIKSQLSLEKCYELSFLAKAVTTFTAQLENMGFESNSCLSTSEFQRLCCKHYSQVELDKRHKDLHCGNVLTSGDRFKIIDLGDMDEDLIASDIARLEVSLRFEMSTQLSDSETVSDSFNMFLNHLMEGFKAGVGVKYLPVQTEIILAYVIQILLYQRYCLLDGVEKIPPAFNVFVRHKMEEFRSGGSTDVEVPNKIDVSAVKTTEKVNLCAAIQINLARLKLFTHCHSDLTKLTPIYLKSLESTYNYIDKHFCEVVKAGQWIYPELLRGINTALKEFPIQAVLKDSHKKTKNIALNLADQLEEYKAIDALVELARHIHDTVGLGAQEHSPIHETIAKLIPKINAADTPAQGEIQQQFNQWARKTRDLRTATAIDLLYDLIDICPHLHPAREILIDLLQRMKDTVYVPLIFDFKNKPIGVVVPIEIKTNFDKQSQPLFCVLGQDTEKKPSWLQVDKDFIRIIKKARDQAYEMLTERSCRPSSTEFQILVSLPDLRMFQQESLSYGDDSIELAVTVAGFCQHHEIKKTVKLNPAIMLMGPINFKITEDNFLPQLRESVGAIHTLLVSSRENIPYSKGIIPVRATEKINFILKKYFDSQELKELFLRNPKVLTFETDVKWNRILIQANKQKDPIIKTIKRHQNNLLDLLDQHKAIQLRGLTGIGKTFLVAQWLKQAEVQNRYDLILYTSVPDTSTSTSSDTKNEMISKWARQALETLSRQLSHRNFEQLELKCRADLLLDHATEFVDVLRQTLADKQVLWVIDNGQELQYSTNHESQEQQSSLEHRFAEIIQQVHTGDWQGCELLYITNQELAEPELPVYPLDDGFTFEEACQYLDKVKDKLSFDIQPLRDTVAQALGAHPKALELLVKHAKDKSVSAAEIQDILNSLPSSTGERELRITVCHKILERIFKYLENSHPKAWWMLMTASTFIGDFNREQFKHVAKKIISNTLDFDVRHDITPASSILQDRSLLNWDGTPRLWNMHSLVRHYSQDVFLEKYSDLYRKAHYFVGLYYFPLSKGRTCSDASSKAKYANAENSAMALYHYEQAQYESGKQAVFQNYYEHPIPKARHFIENKQPYKAEEELKKVVQGYDVGEQGDPLVVAVNMVSPDINYLVAKAIHYQRDPKRYDIAALHYRQAIKQGKKEVVPLLISLLCDMVKGKPETDPLWKEAESLFDEVSESVANNKDVSSYEGLGEMYEKVAQHYFDLNPDDPDMALLIIGEAAEADIAWYQVYRLGVLVSEKNGEKIEAERWLGKAIDTIPNNHSHYIRLANLMAQHNKPDYAEKVYKNAIEKVPYHGLYIAYCRLLEQQNKPEEADKVYKNGIDKVPQSNELYIAYGQFLEQQNKPEDAEQVYKNGIEKVPPNHSLYIAYGQFLEQQNKPEDAEQVYKNGIEKVPPNYSLYIAYGQFLEQQNKPNDAEKVYKKGIEKLPSNEHLYLAYGHLLEQQNKLDEAEKVYKNVIDKHPHRNDLYIIYGRFLEQQNKPKEAEKVYKNGIEKVPHSHDLYIAYGRILEQQNKLDEAEQLYQTAIDKVSVVNHARFYVRLACLLHKQNKLTEAENNCKIGIKKFPSGYLYLTLGYILELQNKSQEAEDIYRIGIKNYPRMSYPYMALGYLLEEQNRLQEAKDTYQIGIEQALQPDILRDDLEQLKNKGI